MDPRGRAGTVPGLRRWERWWWPGGLTARLWPEGHPAVDQGTELPVQSFLKQLEHLLPSPEGAQPAQHVHGIQPHAHPTWHPTWQPPTPARAPLEPAARWQVSASRRGLGARSKPDTAGTDRFAHDRHAQPMPAWAGPATGNPTGHRPRLLAGPRRAGTPSLQKEEGTPRLLRCTPGHFQSLFLGSHCQRGRDHCRGRMLRLRHRIITRQLRRCYKTPPPWA